MESIESIKDKDNALEMALAGEVKTYLQPIINIKNGSIFGYETLSRGPLGSSLEKPVKLIAYANKKKMMHQLEQVCINNSLSIAEKLSSGELLFINLSSVAFCEKNKNIAKYGRKIVIEITETYKEDIDKMVDAAIWYKSKGISIAVDDVMSGYDRLKAILYLKPEYFKLDRELIKNCHKDLNRKEMIRLLLVVGNKLGSRVIAEGVENNQEFFTLRELGLELFQGFLFSRPFPAGEHRLTKPFKVI